LFREQQNFSRAARNGKNVEVAGDHLVAAGDVKHALAGFEKIHLGEADDDGVFSGGKVRDRHGKIRPVNFLAEGLLAAALRADNRQALVAAPVLELAGDEYFPVARGARLLPAARMGN
jgi:hypothetical protein